MAQPIPLTLPDVGQHEIDAVAEVLRGGTLDGAKCGEFERAVAARVGRQHAVATCSGTAALHAMMLACGIDADDEVITTPFAFVSVINSIMMLGARAVFVDIHPKTLNLDPDALEAAITPRTRAILGVEALGHPGGIEEIEQIARRHELAMLEECCDGMGGKAAGRAVGSFGRASCFSFKPCKQITTGEGGMVLTDDDRLAEACRCLRDHGRRDGAFPTHLRLGYSYRMSDVNAAIGLAQLSRLDEISEKRRAAAREYFERLMDNRYISLPTVSGNVSMSWFVFAVRLNDLFEPGDRDELIRQMRNLGVECGGHFPPAHLHPHVMQKYGTRRGELPVCEYLAERTLSLPLFTRISSEQIEHVCDALDRSIEKVLMGRCQGRF